MERRLRIQLHKLFLKKGLGFRSYNLVTKILFILRKRGTIHPFKMLARGFSRVFPLVIVKIITKGKHKIYITLPITFNRAFHIAFTTLYSETDARKSKNTKNFAYNFTSELFETLNKKSQSYKRKLSHLKEVRFALSFK